MFSKMLKAHTKHIRFEQVFSSEKSYNETISKLRSMGFIIDGEVSH